MKKRIIECQVNDEYILGAGVPIGAAGSHNDVVLRLTFNDMWDGLNIYATFTDAIGESSTVVLLMPSMLVLGDCRTYDVVIPFAAKQFEGRMMLGLTGYIASDGIEDIATNTAAAFFRVLPSKVALADDGSIDATIAQQLQSELNRQDEEILSTQEQILEAEEDLRREFGGVDNEKGCRAFRILEKSGIDGGVGTYTLDSVAGLEVGDVYTVYLEYIRSDYGRITSIDDNVVTVDVWSGFDLVDEETLEEEPWRNTFSVSAKHDVGTIDIGMGASAFGYMTRAARIGAISAGFRTEANGYYSAAFGQDTYAGYASCATGRDNRIEGDASFGAGAYHREDGATNLITGYKNEAHGEHSLINGLRTVSSGRAQLVTGSYNVDDPTQAIILGGGSKTERKNTFTVSPAGNGWFAGTLKVGASKDAVGLAKDIEARPGRVVNTCGAIFNNYTNNVASINAVATGTGSKAFGHCSLAAGLGVIAGAEDDGIRTGGAVAFGIKTQATAYCSFAHGSGTVASADRSEAGGKDTKATAEAAVAKGIGTCATRAAQVAVGKYNETDSSALFVVGNGSSDTARSNAFVVKSDGRVFIGGKELKQKFSDFLDEWVGAAPGALDTLDELAAALGDDADFAATVTNKFAEIANKSKETDQVLSEHGEALVKIDQGLTEQQAQIWQISDKSNDTDSRMSRAEKRIENLESGISPDPFLTDGSSAYERSVPEGACPYAELSRIGGSSCGSDGLLKLTDSPVTAVRSVSVTDGENGESVETLLYEFTVPEEIRALEGYGHGVNAEYCSYIDWRPEENIKKFVRRTRRFTLTGTESLWSTQSDSYQTEERMMFALPCNIELFEINARRPGASTHFKFHHYNMHNYDVEGFTFYGGGPKYSNYIYIRINRDKLPSQDVAGFKQYLANQYASGTPVVIEYGISTPDETDLSEILDDDNLIPVSVGGRIVALNAESRDVPLEVTYQIKEAEE